MLNLLDTHLYKSGAPDKLRHLIMYIARAAKYINHSLQMGDLGKAGTQNYFGEEQLALDVLADSIIMDNLKVSQLVHSIMSEEQKDIVRNKIGIEDGYSVAYDPLDGSSLVNANLSIGSIFGIYEGKEFIGKKGKDQVSAISVIYGPRTTLIYTIGKGVHEFTLNDVGEFILTHEDINISEEAKNFSPGNLRVVKDNAKYKKLMEYWMDNGYTLRYSGGMAADINHILKKGQGIFTYPAMSPKYPNGKLRLLFECAPFALLVEQAGGKASSGEMDILEIEIADLQQRTPIYIGSSKEVTNALQFLTQDL